MINSTNIINNLSFIKKQISSAVKKTKRNINDITIVAITKSFSSKIWNIAINNNLRVLGESKIQEAEVKINLNHKYNIELHFIGHLQTNKVQKAIKYFDIIQTVDSIKLLDKINLQAIRANKIQTIYLQINTANDPNKFGFSSKTILEAAEKATQYSNICLSGLMTIPPNNLSDYQLNTIYSKTRKIKNKINNSINDNCNNLSMGMSSDYVIAIKHGATHIRLGTPIFGARPN